MLIIIIIIIAFTALALIKRREDKSIDAWKQQEIKEKGPYWARDNYLGDSPKEKK